MCSSGIWSRRLLIKFVAKLSPVKFFKGIAPAQYVAFTTQSSVGTIPVTLRQLKEALGVDGDVASFTAGLEPMLECQHVQESGQH